MALTIKNLVTKTMKSKSYNKDLYASESELLELSDFQEDKSNSSGMIFITSDILSDNQGEQNGIREQVILLLEESKRDIPYIFTVTKKIGFQGQLETSVYRQKLTLAGTTWLYAKTLNEDSTIDSLIETYYRNELLHNDIQLSYEDLLFIAEVNNYGSSKVELEDDTRKVIVKFNKLGLLADIVVSKLSETKKVMFASSFAVVEDVTAPSSEDIIINEEEEKIEEDFFKSSFDEGLPKTK
ncbi:MAG: hypothetical protein ACPG9K_00950 [Poseidonibacter sp.]